MGKPYVQIECSSVDEFWQYLSPEKPLRRAMDLSWLIFRGQADSTWKLVPKIFRDNNRLAHEVFGHQPTAAEQVYHEAAILSMFKYQCDVAGLRIHNDSMDFREQNLNLNRMDPYIMDPSKWPNDKLLELMALAQHHRVPTRLLDWSRRPHVAAYFAASSAMARRDAWGKDTKLAVWALQTPFISQYPNIRIVSVPGSVSINIAPQQGLFTLLMQKCYKMEPFVVRSLEDEFEEAHTTVLTKIMLPVKFSRQLLKRCNLYGVSAATLFPGYDGAAQAVNDWLNWPGVVREET